MLIRFLPIKSRKGLGRDVFDILSHLSTLPTTLLTQTPVETKAALTILFEDFNPLKKKKKKKEEEED